MQDFGFTVEKLNEGKTLVQKAYDLYNNSILTNNLDNPDDFQLLWNQAVDHYLTLIHISRVALQNERINYIQLGLAGPRKTSLSGWLSQANQYYRNTLSNPEICEKLSDFGILKDKLIEGKKLVEMVEVGIVHRHTNNDKSRKLIQEYDKAIDKMDSWLYRFNTLSRIIFENDPQILNKLKIDNR